ncbi:hypothetical protein Bca52824_030288 [Brassica carinata]|uniref:Uncharacterized protein n=1 Tax=Brassica carinata TaxID=52824 RepID=A0A8X7V4A2_BRACI|nr:hypothetical protein Bca52824_030288 [Brassica carinata]
MDDEVSKQKGKQEYNDNAEVMLDTMRPDLHVINNSERAITLKDDGLFSSPDTRLTQALLVGWRNHPDDEVLNLSVHSNLIVNNIGPENTNRCDAASAIEGCSEVSEPNSLQTDTLANTKEETTGADKCPNYKGS